MENILTTQWSFWQAFALGIGTLLVWLLARIKTYGEIQQTTVATQGMRAEQMVQWFKAETEAREAAKRLEANILELNVPGIEESAKVEGRKLLFHTFFFDYLGAYYKLYGIGRWVFQGREIELIEDELMPFLEISANVVKILNHSPKEYSLLSRYDFGPIIRYILRNTNPFTKRRKELMALIPHLNLE